MSDITKYKDKMNQIIEYANNRDMHISYNIILDILMDKNNDISGEKIAEMIREIGNSGIIIDQGEADEDYANDYRNEAYYEKDSKKPVEPWKYIPAQVNISHRVMTISDVIDRLTFHEFDLNPEFQRKGGLWGIDKQSQLIESLMLKIPLPTFYFDAVDDGKWVVIDGLQRLITIDNFIVQKNFELQGLEYLREFEGCRMDDLPRQYYRRIKETQINVYTVEKGTPADVIYNIFKRINTSGMKLEPQEMRHALYRGNATELIGRMAASDSFLNATGRVIDTSRMLDREYITRYLAFTELDYRTEYKGNIDSYLVKALTTIHQYNEEEQKKVEKDFYNIMNTCSAIFGKYAFRRVASNGKRGPINKALFELWSICLHELTLKERKELVRQKDIVFESFKNLLLQEEFSKWIKSGDKYSLELRVSASKRMLEEILHDPKSQLK